MNESNYQFRGTDDYIISDDLMLTANIAIRMNKPLLVKANRAQARRRWQNPLPRPSEGS